LNISSACSALKFNMNRPKKSTRSMRKWTCINMRNAKTHGFWSSLVLSIQLFSSVFLCEFHRNIWVQTRHTYTFFSTNSFDEKLTTPWLAETSPNYLTTPYSEMTLQSEYPKLLYPESSHLWGQPKSSRKSLKRSLGDWGQLRHSPASSNTLRCHQTWFAGKSKSSTCWGMLGYICILVDSMPVLLCN
jgi:hypothetical protein